MQRGRKIIECGGLSNGIDLNAAIVEIAGPSTQVQSSRFVLHEETKSDALNDAADEPTSRCFWHETG